MRVSSKARKFDDEFLYNLFACALKDSRLFRLVAKHMNHKYILDNDLSALCKTIEGYAGKYVSVPPVSALQLGIKGVNQSAQFPQGVIDAMENDSDPNMYADLLLDYSKQSYIKEKYQEIGKLLNKGELEEAESLILSMSEWLGQSDDNSDAFVDVVATFEDRFNSNHENEINKAKSDEKMVNRFYIDNLDNMNGGRNLRKQLTCVLAPTGVGKSHAARYIGAQAAQDGAHVLHFQLEGSESEVLDAYSGSLAAKSSYKYERGMFTQEEMRVLKAKIASVTGSVIVRSYPRFNNQVSTVDIKLAIGEYHKKYGRNPDIVIVDSMDLLTDSSKRKYDTGQERSKRIAVANDLKDLAGDENVWVVATYQATIENRDWINDEKNVLTEYNCSEAKGLARPCTHLLSLNQSDAERKEKTMRLYVAKSRFFAKGEPFKIATDYNNEQFYDRGRSLSLGYIV